MGRSARVLVASVMCLLPGSFVATVAAQTLAPANPADERSAQVDDALRLSPLKIYLASLRMCMTDALDGDRMTPEIR